MEMRRAAVELLKRVRMSVAAQRARLLAAIDETGPAALHDRRAANRMEISLREIDVTLRHLRRAARSAAEATTPPLAGGQS
jgi:hypothetical protein